MVATVMPLELVNTLAQVGTFAVITATAIAAAVQLSHLRQNNKLQAILALRAYRSSELATAFDFVSGELGAKLDDPEYRAGLEGFAPSREAHKELMVADYFEHIGTYVRNGLIDESIYFETASPERYWKLIEPAIAIYRRNRDATAFENFEYLVVRARKYDLAHPGGTFPQGESRLTLSDPYLAADRATRERARIES
ncbi:MAG: hypothetical protein PVSMB8_16590 [Vulcanimicrobiaceae bacterium]